MKKLIYALLAAISLASVLIPAAQAQTSPTWLRRLQFGGTRDDQVNATAVDASGSTYQTGYFVGTTQCGGQSLTMDSEATYDMYLLKTDAQGTVEWLRQANSKSNRATSPTQTIYGTAQGSQLAIDALGNIYVSGFFQGSVSFGSTTVTLVAPGVSPAAFIAKYSPQGNLLWVQQLQATTRADATGLALSTNGDVYVSGYFAEKLTVGPSTLTSQGSTTDCFLAKYTAGGTLQWIRAFGGPATDYAISLQPGPANSVYVEGQFAGTLLLGPVSLTSQGGSDVFFAQYDDQGNPQWAQAVGGPQNDYPGMLAVAPTGELFGTGTFRGTAQFGGQTATSAGGADGFLVKCTAAGSPLWVRQIGGTGDDYLYLLQQHPAGPLYMSGSFEATATFGNQSLTSAGYGDAFLARYDQAGTCIWAARGGGSLDDSPGGLAINPLGGLRLSVQFIGTTTFGGFATTSRGSTDVVLCQVLDNTALAQRAGSFDNALTISPNPVSGNRLQLSGLQDIGRIQTLRIVDIAGRTVWKQAVTELAPVSLQVGVENLSAGQYLVEVTTDRLMLSKKVLIRHN